MNFSYGVIAIVGVLVAISIALISMSPDDIIEPRIIPEQSPKVSPVACTMEYAPVCGVDGITYGNMCMLDASKINLDYQGECVVAEPEPTPEPAPEQVPPSSAMPIAPQTYTVEIPEGSGALGCEETNECYLPYSLTIRVGDTVSWSNDDSAAHTVTSGSVADGPSGVFDSSLFMAGNTFSYTFDNSGEYPYFCMVHPWMTGVVIVNEINDMLVVSEPMPVPEIEPIEPEMIVEAEPASEPVSMNVNVSIPQGSAVPECEETNSCYIPHEVKIAVGGTVTWSNDDSAAHTVTGGHMPEGPSGVFDSSLFMGGNTFSYTFDNSGEYPYYCMVHPWMTGVVIVE